MSAMSGGIYGIISQEKTNKFLNLLDSLVTEPHVQSWLVCKQAEISG